MKTKCIALCAILISAQLSGMENRHLPPKKRPLPAVAAETTQQEKRARTEQQQPAAQFPRLVAKKMGVFRPSPVRAQRPENPVFSAPQNPYRNDSLERPAAASAAQPELELPAPPQVIPGELGDGSDQSQEMEEEQQIQNQCPICKKTCQNPKDLTQHFASEHAATDPAGNFLCTWPGCDKKQHAFKRKSGLYLHICNMHTHHYRHRCECGIGAQAREIILIHQRTCETHQNAMQTRAPLQDILLGRDAVQPARELPAPPEVIPGELGDGSDQSQEMEEEQQIQNQCPLCKKSHETSLTLTKHFVSEHAATDHAGNFLCAWPECDKKQHAFKRQVGLHLHVGNIHTKNYRYRCECGMGTQGRSLFLAHQKTCEVHQAAMQTHTQEASTQPAAASAAYPQ